MKGTEKQIAWATDIINAPADIIKKYADQLANSPIASDRAKVNSLLKSIDEYRAGVEAIPQLQDASFVIAKRSAFSFAAREAVRRTLLADGIHPAEALLNLANRGL